MIDIASLQVPESIARAIRERGPVLDIAFVKSTYSEALARQPIDGVEIQTDIAYGSDSLQRLDIYRSSSTAGQPILIFLHGGGFIRGDKADRNNVGLYFARQGFIVIVANYRLAPANVWPAGAEDVRDICEWCYKYSESNGADANSIFLAGESAGASHVAAASLIRRFQPARGLRVAGAILISGTYNVHLELLAREQFGIASPDPRNEAYFGSEFSRYPSMTTVDLIDVSHFPLLITYAELDLLQMQVQAGELFGRLVKQHGFVPSIEVIRQHNHLTQTYAINTGDTSVTSPMLNFMRRVQQVQQRP